MGVVIVVRGWGRKPVGVVIAVWADKVICDRTYYEIIRFFKNGSQSHGFPLRCDHKKCAIQLGVR